MHTCSISPCSGFNELMILTYTCGLTQNEVLQIARITGVKNMTKLLMPSPFIMNSLGLRFYFLAEKLGYRTYNLSR